MSKLNVVVRVVGTILCEGQDMQPGASVRLNLDTVSYPGLPDYIVGTVQIPINNVNLQDPATGCLVRGSEYTITYESDELLGVLPLLVASNILSVRCVTGWETLDTRISLLEALVPPAFASIADAGITVTGSIGVPTAVPLADVEANNLLDVTTTPATITIPVGQAGTYRITSSAVLANASGGPNQFGIGFSVDALSWFSGYVLLADTVDTSLYHEQLLDLAEGDVVTPALFVATGGDASFSRMVLTAQRLM